jgi:hypothetical protein
MRKVDIVVNVVHMIPGVRVVAEEVYIEHIGVPVLLLIVVYQYPGVRFRKILGYNDEEED